MIAALIAVVCLILIYLGFLTAVLIIVLHEDDGCGCDDDDDERY